MSSTKEIMGMLDGAGFTTHTDGSGVVWVVDPSVKIVGSDGIWSMTNETDGRNFVAIGIMAVIAELEYWSQH